MSTQRNDVPRRMPLAPSLPHSLFPTMTNERLATPHLSTTLPSAVTGSCQPAASFAGYGNFTILSQPSGITKRLQDVLAFKVRIVSQYFLNGVARTDLANDHPYGHTHATDARLSAHHSGIMRN